MLGNRSLHGVLPGARRTAADAEAVDQRAEALDVLLRQVLQQATALTDEDQQTTAGVVVVLVGLEVLGQVGDPTGQQSDLDLGGAGVTVLGTELGDDLLLHCGVERHAYSSWSVIATECPRSTSRGSFRDSEGGDPLGAASRARFPAVAGGVRTHAAVTQGTRQCGAPSPACGNADAGLWKAG